MPDVVKIVEHSDLPVVFKSEIDGQEHPIEKLRRAYSSFLLGDKRLSEIAQEVELPLVIVEEMSFKGRWVERKIQYCNETIRALDAEVRRTQATERVETIKQQIAKARDVRDKAHEMAMRAAGTPKALKDAADAMATAAAMEARAAGVAEKTIQRDVMGEGSEPIAKFSWVGITVVPRAPDPEPKVPVINVESQEVK